MVTQNNQIKTLAYNLLYAIEDALNSGARIFDSKGHELKTTKDVIVKMNDGDKITICENEKEYIEFISRKN